MGILMSQTLLVTRIVDELISIFSRTDWASDTGRILGFSMNLLVHFTSPNVLQQ